MYTVQDSFRGKHIQDSFRSNFTSALRFRGKHIQDSFHSNFTSTHHNYATFVSDSYQWHMSQNFITVRSNYRSELYKCETYFSHSTTTWPMPKP